MDDGSEVFLSYNRSDADQVKEIGGRLKAAGVGVWLDSWNLVAGDVFQKEIDEALRSCQCCLVFIGPDGIGPWQNAEMRAAIDRHIMDRTGGFRVIPVLLPGSQRLERSALPAFLAEKVWVEFNRLAEGEAFERLLRGIRGRGSSPAAPMETDAEPYRGLQAFDVENANDFFGREAETDWLIASLRELTDAAAANRFLSVTGPSGSGKSSLARAGLLHAIESDAVEGGKTWPRAITRPGHDPLESLALALTRAAGEHPAPVSPASLIDDLARDERTLHLYAELAAGSSRGAPRYLVFVDQLEELFTLCSDEARRHAFLANLLYASSAPQGATVVVVTIRSDFLGRCAKYASLARSLSDHQHVVGPMSETELGDAIRCPAELHGHHFEDGLVEKLVADVSAQPAALPLLQHCLLELWHTRRDGSITLGSYQALGGIQGCLERRADAIFEALGETDREICRRIFLRLTEPGQGTEDTRRRVSFGELIVDPDQRDATERVVGAMSEARARLLTVDSEGPDQERYVEVAHEALIRGWHRLREWIETDREGLETQRKLTRGQKDWEEGDRDRSLLFIGSRLAPIAAWAEENLDELNEAERAFLLRCLVAEDLNLDRWIPRFDAAREVFPLATELLHRGGGHERLEGLEILRWLESTEFADRTRRELLSFLESEPKTALRRRAAEILLERGDLAELCRVAIDADSPSRERYVEALGHLRNRPERGAEVASELPPALNRRVGRSAAYQLVGENIRLLAIVFAATTLAGFLGWGLVSAVNAILPFDSVGFYPAFYNEAIPIAISLGLYVLLRSQRDGVVAPRWRYLLAGLLGAALYSLLLHVPAIAAEWAEFATAVDGDSEELVDQLNQPAGILGALPVFALSMRAWSLRRPGWRHVIWYALLASLVAVPFTVPLETALGMFEPAELPARFAAGFFLGSCVLAGAQYGMVLGIAEYVQGDERRRESESRHRDGAPVDGTTPSV